MFRMPILALVLYIAARIAIDGQVIDESMVELFGRAGLHLTSREILSAAEVGGSDAVTVH
jgi:hypothetical protein